MAVQSIIAKQRNSRRRSSLGHEVDSSLYKNLSENAKHDGGVRFDRTLRTLLNGVSIKNRAQEILDGS